MNCVGEKASVLMRDGTRERGRARLLPSFPWFAQKAPQERRPTSVGRIAGLAWLVCVLFFAPLARADDVITNIMSPIVSYAYLNSLDEPGTIVSSPISSYLYMEWPGDDVLQLQQSPAVSYYLQYPDAPPLVIVATNRTPTMPETTPRLGLPGAYPQQLKTFVSGALSTNALPDPARTTIVLTHGWKSSPEEWAMNMATELSLNVAGSPNILVWDWREAAATYVCKSWQLAAAAQQTPDQGVALGMALISKLGPTYTNRIHFIGHSLGTLVNGMAAMWIHSHGYSPTNTHLTLLDEAEVATDLGCVELFQAVLSAQWNPLAPRPYYYRPLPSRFAWADNYITAFGLLHPGAHNVILTNGFPVNASGLSDLKRQLSGFHSYPCQWYTETIITDVSAMGHRWSFERGGFADAPTTNTVYVQAASGSLWDLATTNYVGASDYLNGRFQKYRDALAFAITRRAPDSVHANGTITGEMMATGPLNGFNSFILSLLTKPVPQPPPAPPRQRKDGEGSGTGAYAWMLLPVPAEAASMSFDFRIEGDWRADSLAVALNGTNVLLLAGGGIDTNMIMSSGMLDVTEYAGRTNELFIGIVGGTSTNALLTVENVAFYTTMPPSLHAQVVGGSLLLSWPMTPQNFNLECTTNLAVPSAWGMVTNLPVIEDLRCNLAVPVSGAAGFYRLRR